jgi:hypothetical protein
MGQRTIQCVKKQGETSRESCKHVPHDIRVTISVSCVQPSSDFRASSPAHAVSTDPTIRGAAQKSHNNSNSNSHGEDRHAKSRRSIHARRGACVSIHRTSAGQQDVHATSRSSAFTRTRNIIMDGQGRGQKLSSHAQRHAIGVHQAALCRGARHAGRVPPVVVCEACCEAEGQHGRHFPPFWGADCGRSLAPSGEVPPKRFCLAHERYTGR